MHVKAYVLLSKEEADTSLAARQKVMTELLNDPTFINEHGRFGCSVCDWFLIGGGNSGQLYPQRIRDEFFLQIDQLASEEDKSQGYSSKFIQNNRKELEEIWHKLGGKCKSPLTRHVSSELGEEDDACLLNNELAEELNTYLQANEYTRETFAIYDSWWNPVVIAFKDYLLCDIKGFEEMVGKYWIVIINYHK